jgi:hypothetical protein
MWHGPPLINTQVKQMICYKLMTEILVKLMLELSPSILINTQSLNH